MRKQGTADVSDFVVSGSVEACRAAGATTGGRRANVGVAHWW